MSPVRFRREDDDVPAEAKAAAAQMVTPGLEGLAAQTLGGKVLRALAGTDTARAKRGRRAPAVPVPVGEPSKKRGRRA